MEAFEIAVIIPAYRAAATLRRAVDSVARAGCETHVVFDGPDPRSERTIEDFSHVRRHRLPAGSGAPACRNAGLAKADAPFVLFLDADDYIEGPLIAEACRTAKEAQADLVLAPFAFEYPDGSRQVCDPRLRYREADALTLLRAWLAELYTPPCGVLWRRTFLRAIGGWDESIAKNQDGDLIYRGLVHRPRCAFSTEGLGVYVQNDDPGRITRRHDRRALSSQLRVLNRVRAMAAEQNFAVDTELARAYYALARLAYTHDDDHLGALAERAARELGLASDPGDVAHRALAKILGLRGKQRFARFARGAADLGLAIKERVWPIPLSSASTGAPPLSAPTSATTPAPRLTPSVKAKAR